MKCNNCDNDGALRKIGIGMSGPTNEGKMPLCDGHFAEWLFNMDDVEGVAKMGDGLVFAAVEAIEDSHGLLCATLDMHMDDGVVRESLGGADAVVSLSRTIESELIPPEHADTGDTIGFVVIDSDADGESVMNFGLLPEYQKSHAHA